MRQASCHLYIVRHGETAWNREGLCQGHTDIPLSSVGIEQAKSLSREFQEIPLEAIYSSDLCRAKQTALLASQHSSSSIITSTQLRERFYGNWEGKPISKLREILEAPGFLDDPKAYSQFLEQNHMEHEDTVINRSLEFFLQVANSYSQGENLLIFTHGALMKLFFRYLGFFQNRDMIIKNTGWVQLSYRNKEFVLERHQRIEAR